MEVSVYRNLHNGLLSIRHGSHVIGHARSVYLHDPRFSVSKAGRERVLREGRKNVHAFMKGCLSMVDGFVPFKDRGLPSSVLHVKDGLGFMFDCRQHVIRVGYNPYKWETFVDVYTKQPIAHAGKLDVGIAHATKGIHVAKYPSRFGNYQDS